MPSRKYFQAYLRSLLLVSLLLTSLPSRSQAPASQATQTPHPQSSSAKPYDSRETTPELPPGSLAQAPEAAGVGSLFRGFNTGVTIAGIHDSVVGWATLATPSVGYILNDTFSMDASIPIYMYRLAQSLSARPRLTQLLVNQRAELGDVILGFHAQFAPKLFVYQATLAVTAPTGDEEYGLTTGRCTFDLNNRFERTYGRLTPNLELGVGDSSYLVNRTVNKNYTSLGPISHYQIGLALELLRGSYFETDVYENLPIGDQKIYGPSRNGRATIVTGHNVTEDNGFTNSLEIPLDRHTSLTSYYSRSLRLKIDSVAFGVTYILRPPPLPPADSSLDDLFR